MAFAIEFSPDARDHLRSLRKRDQQIIIDGIAAQLTHQPDQPTSQRKPLENNPVAPWELRVGDYRVFYDVDEIGATVIVKAVGKKEHNKLYIREKEYEL